MANEIFEDTMHVVFITASISKMLKIILIGFDYFSIV